MTEIAASNSTNAAKPMGRRESGDSAADGGYAAGKEIIDLNSSYYGALLADGRLWARISFGHARSRRPQPSTIIHHILAPAFILSAETAREPRLTSVLGGLESPMRCAMRILRVGHLGIGDFRNAARGRSWVHG